MWTNKFIIILDYCLCRVFLAAKKTKNTAVTAFWQKQIINFYIISLFE